MCPKCKSNDTWEDNFWSGCNRCGWTSSCENMIVLRRNTSNDRDYSPIIYTSNSYREFDNDE